MARNARRGRLSGHGPQRGRRILVRESAPPAEFLGDREQRRFPTVEANGLPLESDRALSGTLGNLGPGGLRDAVTPRLTASLPGTMLPLTVRGGRKKTGLRANPKNLIWVMPA